MWTYKSWYPLGFPAQSAFWLTLGGLLAAFGLGFLRFAALFSSARDQLYHRDIINGEVVRCLIDDAVMPPFPTLLGGVFLSLLLAALCLAASAGVLYRWHWVGSRSIYRMKLLPHRGELWRRVLAMPLAGLAACGVLGAVLLLLCALLYRFGTPEGHLPLNCWGSFPFTWMGGYHA